MNNFCKSDALTQLLIKQLCYQFKYYIVSFPICTDLWKDEHMVKDLGWSAEGAVWLHWKPVCWIWWCWVHKIQGTKFTNKQILSYLNLCFSTITISTTVTPWKFSMQIIYITLHARSTNSSVFHYTTIMLDNVCCP
jgi:hypothetical protein